MGTFFGHSVVHSIATTQLGNNFGIVIPKNSTIQYFDLQYIALKTLAGNTIIGACFSLTLLDVIPLTLLSVSLLFGVSLLLGCIMASILYYFILRKKDFIL